MIGNHVAQGARGIKVAATLFHADGFRICDLNVIYVAPVPDRLEYGVVEAENENVLHRLFAEIMVNPIYLIFGEHCLDLSV